MTTLRSNLTATAGALALGCAFLFATAPANALGLKDCSDKYSAAKAAGKAGNKTFADFQKSECGADAKPAAAPAAAATTPAVKPADAKPAAKPADTKPAAKPADLKPADAKPADAKPAAKAADTKPAAAAATAPATPTVDKKAADKAAAKAARAEKRKADAAAKAAAKPVTAPASPAIFPTAIADTYKAKKPAKARFATCLAQYKANKATNANGGLKWIQKGGGYYAQCNKKLKG
jgi:hypothetical protein